MGVGDDEIEAYTAEAANSTDEQSGEDVPTTDYAHDVEGIIRTGIAVLPQPIATLIHGLKGIAKTELVSKIRFLNWFVDFWGPRSQPDPVHQCVRAASFPTSV